LNRTEIIAAVDKAHEKAKAAFNWKEDKPSIGFFSKSATAGLAKAWQNRLEFNEVLAKENPTDFENTVIHEYAHLVTRKLFPRAKQSHGPEFKSVMRRMGGQPNTYHSYNVDSVVKRKTKTRYEVKCGCSKHWVTKRVAEMTRLVKNPIFCKLCKGACTYTGNKKAYV